MPDPDGSFDEEYAAVGYRVFRGFWFAGTAVALIVGTRWLFAQMGIGFGWGGPAYDLSAEVVSIFVGCWVVWRFGDVVWPLPEKYAARPERPRRQDRA